MITRLSKVIWLQDWMNGYVPITGLLRDFVRGG